MNTASALSTLLLQLIKEWVLPTQTAVVIHGQDDHNGDEADDRHVDNEIFLEHQVKQRIGATLVGDLVVPAEQVR